MVNFSLLLFKMEQVIILLIELLTLGAKFYTVRSNSLLTNAFAYSVAVIYIVKVWLYPYELFEMSYNTGFPVKCRDWESNFIQKSPVGFNDYFVKF